MINVTQDDGHIYAISVLILSLCLRMKQLPGDYPDKIAQSNELQICHTIEIMCLTYNLCISFTIIEKIYF